MPNRTRRRQVRVHPALRSLLAWLGVLSLGLLLQAPFASTYDIYEDEYQNKFLPGSSQDTRGLPNSPFDVVSNRLSDGMSSRSILTTTSPAFPRYRDVLLDPNLRKTYYNIIKESEKFQGKRRMTQRLGGRPHSVVVTRCALAPPAACPLQVSPTAVRVS